MIRAATRRAIDRHGENLTIRNYARGASDAHGDAERVETADSPYATRGRVDAENTPQADRDAGGTILDYDVRIYIAAESSAGTERAFAPSLTGVGDDEPPSEIERDAHGRTYRVVRARNQSNGLLAIDARVMQ